MVNEFDHMKTLVNVNPHLFEFNFDNLYHINLKKHDNQNFKSEFGDVKVIIFRYFF
jgi:hypothetical protein